MIERTRQEQAVVANLADAGCDNEQIEQFMDFLKSGRKEAGLSLLAKHRRRLRRGDLRAYPGQLCQGRVP